MNWACGSSSETENNVREFIASTQVSILPMKNWWFTAGTECCDHGAVIHILDGKGKEGKEREEEYFSWKGPTVILSSSWPRRSQARTSQHPPGHSQPDITSVLDGEVDMSGNTFHLDMCTWLHMDSITWWIREQDHWTIWVGKALWGFSFLTLRQQSQTVPPALLSPPPTHVPNCHIHTSVKSLQGRGLHHCPGQAFPELNRKKKSLISKLSSLAATWGSFL